MSMTDREVDAAFVDLMKDIQPGYVKAKYELAIDARDGRLEGRLWKIEGGFKTLQWSAVRLRVITWRPLRKLYLRLVMRRLIRCEECIQQYKAAAQSITPWPPIKQEPSISRPNAG